MSGSPKVLECRKEGPALAKRWPERGTQVWQVWPPATASIYFHCLGNHALVALPRSQAAKPTSACGVAADQVMQLGLGISAMRTISSRYLARIAAFSPRSSRTRQNAGCAPCWESWDQARPLPTFTLRARCRFGRSRARPPRRGCPASALQCAAPRSILPGQTSRPNSRSASAGQCGRRLMSPG